MWHRNPFLMNTFKYDFETLKDMIQKENPKILLLASPNNPTGNGLTPKELDELLAEVPSQTVVLGGWLRQLISSLGPGLIIRFHSRPSIHQSHGR